MKTIIRRSALLIVAVLWTGSAFAQPAAQAKPQAPPQAKPEAKVQALTMTVDEFIEKHLTAMGGRAALAKIESRIATGSIIVGTQGMEIPGSVEINLKAPNKSRSLIRLDLSAAGGAEMIVDQRCDGKSAFSSNSMQGDKEITGSQLQGMINSRFPSPLLTYKDAGTVIELVGKEKVGTRDTIVLKYTPKAGSASRQFYDAETYLLLRTITTVDAPELGGAAEQTSDLSDYREVDGVKIPCTIQTVNPVQTITIRLEKIEHNKPIDDAVFARPIAK